MKEQRKWDSWVKSGRRSWSGRKRYVTERELRGSHKTANILESHGVVVGKARIAFSGLPIPRFRQWHFNRASDSWRSRVFLWPLIRVATLPEPTHSSSSFRVTRGCEFYVYEFTCRPACRNEHRTRCGHTDTLSNARACTYDQHVRFENTCVVIFFRILKELFYFRRRNTALSFIYETFGDKDLN